MEPLNHIFNELHLKIVRTIAEGNMGVVYEARQRHVEQFERRIAIGHQAVQDMLTALEIFLYGNGYGPTNEKLALNIKDLYSESGAGAAQRWLNGRTPGIKQETLSV